MQTNQTNTSIGQRQPIDRILFPHEAAEFLGVTEEELHNATCQGYLPGACIDGQWRFSQRALSKFCSQRNNHNMPGVPWLEEPYGPYWLGDFVEKKAKKVIEQYAEGERYFPDLTIEGGIFSGLDLSGIDFWESSLDGADFSGTKLKNAGFVLTSLKSAVFKGADLSDANFEGANVEDADFRGAILNRTMFAVGSMRGAKLDGTQISLAKF